MFQWFLITPYCSQNLLRYRFYCNFILSGFMTTAQEFEPEYDAIIKAGFIALAALIVKTKKIYVTLYCAVLAVETIRLNYICTYIYIRYLRQTQRYQPTSAAKATIYITNGQTGKRNLRKHIHILRQENPKTTKYSISKAETARTAKPH